MLNPDGVVLGNYRTSCIGKDLNRSYTSPNYRLHPESYQLKELMKDLKRYGHIYSFFDIHGHSSKKCNFIYGPHFQLHETHYNKIRILPKILSQITPTFRYWACKYNIE